jgi:branched-chain amino acid transport system substrate-binding protein
VTLFYPRAVNEIRMFAKAANGGQFDRPTKIAAKLEGMKSPFTTAATGVMRKSDDHQFLFSRCTSPIRTYR